MNLLFCLLIFVEILVAVWIAYNVVQCWLPNSWLHKNALLILESAIKLLIFLTKLLNCFDINVIDGYSVLASSIGIDTIIEQEGVVVDDAATV